MRPFDALRAEAERYYAEKSFSRAHDVYEKAAQLQLTEDERRWLEFRLADTAMRADAANPNENDTQREAARTRLETIATSSPDLRLRAEAHEALGDMLATHGWIQDPRAAQTHYLAALDYWAGSDELALARQRYLAIVFRMPGDYGMAVPREVLVNATTIAQTADDRAHTRYMLAQQLGREGRAPNVERAFELYEEILRDARDTQWYSEALFAYAALEHTWSEATARRTTDDAPRASATKALELLRRYVREFGTNAKYSRQAQQLIGTITNVSVTVMAGATFLPESEQQIALAWRNTTQVELAIYAVDLTTDVQPTNKEPWAQTIDVAARTPLRRWTYETRTPQYEPGQAMLDLDPRLPMGAYIVTAQAGGRTSRQLLLVSDAHILVHMAGGSARVFVSDVETGEPIPNARVTGWTEGRTPQRISATTNANGLAEFESLQSTLTLITAASGKRQAWHHGYMWSYMPPRGAGAQWRVYAFTDRPAYRPNETVHWKVIARAREGNRWITPSGTVEYTITSPRGEKVATGKGQLNAFGSFWSDLALTEAMALGGYTVEFHIGDRSLGYAELFALEEYKLPEFLVNVTTPDATQYRLGDTVEANIEATYYFGGGVANATVEAVVFSKPLQRYWFPWRKYPWYWDEIRSDYQSETEVMRQTLKTDANGRAVLRIETLRDANDTTYRIEARVVDASRREVTGQGVVNVMRQRYTVMAQPEHYVFRPGDSASVLFKAIDANEKPVQTTGTVTVVRRFWSKDAREYTDQEVLTRQLATNAAGEATLTFTPTAIGYYAIRWRSGDGDTSSARDRVTAETTIWVTDRATTDVGFVSASGVDVIVDKESMRTGETANVLIAVPSGGRWVMLTTSAGTLLETQVLHLEGNVRLVQIPIDDRHVPNFFITASSIFDRELATDAERIVVPPAEHFLDVEVKTDREEYEPRQEGRVTITTRDASGKPVAAEVALAVSDEAVTAIRRDPAGDPRQFFFGELNHTGVQVAASVQSQRYVNLREERERAAKNADELARRRAAGRLEDSEEGGVVGGVVGGAVGAFDAAVAESITVTASAPAMAPSPAPPPPPASVAPPPPVAQAKGAGAANESQVVVRSDFRTTAFWRPDVVTDANGTATVAVKFPEGLTTWRATARAVTAGSQVGMSSSTARTNLPMLVRLQSPRFFVVGDRSTVSAVVNNNTDAAITVTPSIDVQGLTLEKNETTLTVPAHGEARADWTVIADRAGEARLRVTARGGAYGDAMEKTFVVYEHGIDKLVARSGKLRGDEALVRLELPRERRATDLTVQVAPSLAVTMLDALPYLLDFPYGCTEQTMSRFLPAAIVARTLERLGLDPNDRLPRAKLDAVTRASINRLLDMQHDNGAWGWWKESGDDAYMTAYVVWGFSIAREAKIEFDPQSIDSAAEWLEQNLSQQRDDWNGQAWTLHALSAWRGNKVSPAERTAFDAVWSHRERLSAQSRALLALTAHRYGNMERAQVLVRNLEDGVRVDRAPDQSVLLKGATTTAETMATAHWGASGFWWYWYESPVETTAFALQALVTIDPKNALIAPAMNWLVRNRRGAHWSNTRDTAITLLSMNDYLEQSGELRGDVSYELSVNGRVIATKTVTAADVLRAPSRFSIAADVLRDTTQEVRIRRTGGNGPIYFAAEARFVSLEEPVKAAGNELFVKREYFRFKPRPTLLKGMQYDRVPLRDGESLPSGERVEVVVSMDVKNDYEYLVFEDLKPAGLEAVELQSGQPLWATNVKSQSTAFVYQELRDRKVALFIDHLPQGVWEVRYTLRAETPGTFHALPVIGQGMYAPEVRGNSDEVRMTVTQ
ncbi:MAG: MG2 domain-containing protein [Acidobacteriota bacterium]|nr:MG2 domain-containing protein [Acidobacteriota bacterium]